MHSQRHATHFFIGLLLIFVLGLSQSAGAETLNVAVASNFIVAMQEIEREFESSSQHELRLIRGSSGKHYAQISNGAPFDVFLSADQYRPRRLIEEGSAIEDSLTTYALGQLALWSRKDEQDLGREYLLNTDNYEVLAIANPRLAPYGQAAMELLNLLGLNTLLAERLVMGENVAQAFQFAFSGNADLGLVAYSQTLSENLSGRGTTWVVPSELYQPIRQDLVIVKDTPAAQEFVEFLTSTAVHDILLRNGYLLPGEAR